MRYEHKFIVTAPLQAVRRFHARSASMGAITPPPVIVRMKHAPEILQEGDEMAFTMWLGPLPIDWLARIEETSATGFVDRQLAGPFVRWVHRHTFRAIDATSTEVIDQIEIELSSQWHWKAIGWMMWLNLPILFAYRQWKTKQILGASPRLSTHADDSE